MKLAAKWLLVAGGIFAPVFMLVWEFQTHQLSGCLFDPMPTPWHAVLLAILPITQVLAWLTLYRTSSRLLALKLACFLLGFAAAVSLLYALAIGPDYYAALMFLCFLPIMAFSRQVDWDNDFMLFYNAFSAITPLLVLLGLWIIGRRLRRLSAVKHERLSFAGFFSGLAFTVIVETPAVQIHQELITAAQRVETGLPLDDLKALRSKRGLQTTARLCHPAHQFSSAGALYAVGPVDVFGPTVRILNGYSHPVIYGNHGFTWRRDYMRQIYDKLTGGTTPVPYSWRGISAAEKSRFENEKAIKSPKSQ
jgi:hypothetical protein